jgi:hypothetical protein
MNSTIDDPRKERRFILTHGIYFTPAFSAAAIYSSESYSTPSQP